MRTLRLPALTFLVLMATPNVWAGLRLLCPPERISVTNNSIFAVGKTDAPVVEVRWSGYIIERVKVKDSIFHVRLSFGYGLNEFTFTAIGKDSTSQQVILEIMSGPSEDSQYEGIYRHYDFHQMRQQTECRPCHIPRDADKSEVSDLEACSECHIDTYRNFRRHSKLEAQSCLICHDISRDLRPISGGNTYMQNPCFRCHQDKIGFIEQDFVHGPAAGGACVICHAPHGSTYDRDLRQPVQVLCISCHDQLEAQMDAQDVHKPFELGNCIECHDPHATNYQWVLIRSSDKLCLKCHSYEKDLKNHGHPFSGEPNKKLAANLKLTKQGELECITCHSPHSTNSPFLLRKSDKTRCVGCHPDIL